MFFHPETRRVLLLGDLRDDAAAWEWDGHRWTRRAMIGAPRVVDYAIAYDAGRGELVLFGGVDQTTEDRTWSWDGATWR